MRHVKHFICIASVALALGGCAGFSDSFTKIRQAYNVVTTARVPASTIAVAIQTFDAIEITATEYLMLRRCTGSNGPVCRDPGITQMIKAGVQTGRPIRNELLTFIKNNPDGLGPQDAYDKLVAATEAVRAGMRGYMQATGRTS